ncbi:hypothetical protein EHQ43_07525 [Leptospira bouyouniensis]|uniref:Uncharacterized protein n=1 Tax=Leptospira bouyouniensis TaxID=2484911 RepID=A0A7I0IR63_9LEPT|nr:hypothetical protein [Leptospira bouyouniensis]TGL07258.1 hypothetical protein EHQ43_07525 [Leptospira bouyouniensis]
MRPKFLQNSLLRVSLIYFLFFTDTVSAKTWSDLESEKETKIYGSERSAKYKASNIFYDIEDWKDHYSIHALGFYRYYDYPLSKSKTVFPFYHHIQSKKDKREYKRIINVNITKENDSIQKSVFPFVFWGYDTNSSYITAIPLFYQKQSSNQNILGFPILPILYYHNKENLNENQNRYIRLFTILHYETTNHKGLHELSLTPIFYYSKDNYLFLPLLLYYQNFRSSLNEYWLGPVYYSKDQTKEERLFVFFPFIGSYVSPKKEIDFIFPIYLNMKDNEEDYHINLFWYTKVHDVNADLATNDGNVYLDYDFGLFYNLVGISQRTKILKGNILKRNDSNSEKPELKRKREFNRENSDQFIGYQLLFGIFSYEKADTKKHIRLLPLAWFTWDDSSEDEVVLLPPFFPIWFSYVADDLEYKILFPLYGKQKEKNSELVSYLLNFYIKEEYKENNLSERSYFWPFVNVYRSDIYSGHRVLPFYIQKNETNESKSTYKNYTLFSIYEETIWKNFERKEFLIWPLWISYDKIRNYKKESETTIWITPFYYRNQTNTQKRTNLLWFIDWEWRQSNDHSLQNNNQNETSKEKLSHILVFPFYFSDSSFSIIPLSFNFWNQNEFRTFTLLNYYHWKKDGHYYNFLYLLESENTELKYKFKSLGNLLWSIEKTPKELSRFTVLWLGYDYTTYKKTVNFFPLFRIMTTTDESSKMIGPFLYYHSKSNEEMTELALLGIGYYHNETKSDKQYSTYVLLGILYQEKTELERGFVKRGSLWGWLWEYQTEENGYEKFSILKLFSYSKEPDGTKKILGISI